MPKHTFFDKNVSKSELKLDLTKRRPEERQRSPSPTEIASPKERFKDAKEKFLLLERERLEEQEKLIQMNIEKKKSAHSPEYPIVSQIPATKPRSSKNWPKGRDVTSDEYENKRRSMAYPNNEYKSEEDFVDVTEKRRSIARPSYHRNKSVESLNSEDYPSITSAGNNCYNGRNEGGGISLSRSKLNSFREDERYNNSRMNRYHSSEIPCVDQKVSKRCKSPVNNVPAAACPRPAPRSYSEDYLPDHADNKRYRDMSRSQHSVPFAEDDSIPLQRYRSPTRHVDNTRMQSRSNRNQQYSSYNEDDANQRRVKRSDSKYYSKPAPSPNEADKRRSMLDALEDEKRKSSNEIAKEFKRRSYQDHRTASEISYQGNPPRFCNLIQYNNVMLRII